MILPIVLTLVGFVIVLAEVFFPSMGMFALMAAAAVVTADVLAYGESQTLMWSLIAAQVQMSGPQLTPANVERVFLSLPSSGGWEATKNPLAILIKYGPGDYTAIEDSRHTYWDPNATSKIDGKPGAYVALEGGRRFEIGKWPAGEPRT